jgi:translation initiation factor 1
MSRPGDNSRLVYSTDGGRTPHNRLVPSKPSPAPAANVPNDGIVRIQRDKKGRGGKTATTITGLPGADADLDALLKSLKQYCGTGGSREGRTLVLQGDQRERLLERLLALGHKAKLAGG